MSNLVFGYPTNRFNVADANSYFMYGMALLDGGLAVQSANNGVGLVTRGLVWQGYDVWGPDEFFGVTTSWSADPSSSITTTWTADNEFNDLPQR